MEQMTFHELTDKLTVLYTQGKFTEALELVEQNADYFPEQVARTTFWRMCLLSLSNRPQDVTAVFQQGLDSGHWWNDELFSDPDLNAVRDLPEFQRLAAVSQEKYEEARIQIERDYTLLYPEPPSSGLYPLLITLHGRNGNKEDDLGRWDLARQRGWLVLSVQSTQPMFRGAYHWDNPEWGLADLRFYYDQVSGQYQIDPQRIVIAGFSQGSGMAIYTALSGKTDVRGFIGIASWWADPRLLIPQRDDAKRVRGYFITGEKDHTFETAKEIQNVLKENNISFEEESYPDLAHEFPPDFERSFEKAIDFIFMEKV
jgi:dienelactone hydrolase